MLKKEMDDLGENGIEHHQFNIVSAESEKIDMQDDLQELHSNCQIIDKEPPISFVNNHNESNELEDDDSDEGETPDDICTDYDETLGTIGIDYKT